MITPPPYMIDKSPFIAISCSQTPSFGTFSQLLTDFRIQKIKKYANLHFEIQNETSK